MTKRGIAGAVVALLLPAGVVGAVVRFRGGLSASSSGGGSTMAPVKGAPGPFAGTPVAPDGTSVGGEGAGSSVGDLALTRPGPVDIGPKIVKEATLTLAVKKGVFTDRFQQAVTVAGAHHGFVETSETGSAKLLSGMLLIRVPVSEFEAALADLKGLGTVKRQSVSGQDVTARFVDLEGRLRNWKAQEVVLLNLMSKATTIVDSIRVQGQLQEVQANIEQIEGQLRLLSDQAAMSTISLSMAEAGPVPPPPAKSTLAGAWHQALHGFVAVLAAVVVGLGYLIPLGVIALLIAFGWRLVTRRSRPAVAEG